MKKSIIFWDESSHGIAETDKNSNAMNKVINYLGLRKVAINLQLDKLPPNVDQYVAEVGAELQEELRQIDQALLVLSNVVGQSEQCTHENEVQRQGDGFIYTVCGDCGEDLD